MVCKDSRLETARKYVHKIKKQVMARMGRLHRGLTVKMIVTMYRRFCMSLLIDETWELKEKEELKLVMGPEIYTF